MGDVLRWLRRNEGVGWAGLAVGLIGLFASREVGWTSLPGAVLAAVGGVLVGVTGAGVLASRRAKHVVECRECLQECKFTGPRGDVTNVTSALLFRARQNAESFIYCKDHAAGQITSKVVRFRNLGKDRARTDKPDFFALSRQQLFETTVESEGTTISIHPPVPLRKGEYFEIREEEVVRGSFGNDDEFVERRALYPIKKLTLRLVFCDGSRVTNSLGAWYEGLVPVGSQALKAVAEGRNTVVNWTVEHIRAGENYRISWRWL